MLSLFKARNLHLFASTAIHVEIIAEPIAREPSEFEKAVLFYDKHYDLIVNHILVPGEKVTLGDMTNRVCRFCSRTKPEVTFKKVAHAIPEGLGNKSLVSAYECDPCNEFFGSGIEDDLGKWSKPMRTLARISGKNGVPTLKKGGDLSWRIEYDRNTGFKIESFEHEPIFEIDEEHSQLKLKLRREAHVPLAVLKAFWKIAYTIMPEEELPNFQHLLRWIFQTPHLSVTDGNVLPVFYTFQPGPMPPDVIGVAILRRKPGLNGYPYAFLALRYGNETFQVLLPSAQHDVNGTSQPMARWQFPTLVDQKTYGTARHATLDWSSTAIAKGEAEFVVHANFIKSRDLRSEATE
ncbi:HNH endonuclease [Rhizobium ruizarguesonis]|uniref:HNH endonuclease n=1 Tax=Rhizobium ruizarguesonis TaxID=2081791 RepID=UPI001031249D|nr:HNH endonuclease [Rhizobium ruizarguesonis]TBE02318.1 HNH endonuclease [Rhizobium ruizarguesonis]TBF14695.1 HNH endonuclease [Rhizobium ruizarguesonis]